jgi:hypothetical protein
MPAAPGAHKRPKPAVILIVPLIVVTILTLFAWPSARLEPRDLPIGVAGPAAAVAPMEQQLRTRDGAFSVERYPDQAAAREAIEEREIYGAFVATPGGGKVLTAPAASSMVAQMLTHAAETASPAGALPVEDVVSASPRATALSSSVLPLVIAGLITGIAATMLAAGAWARAGLIVTGAVLSGLGATAIIHSWLDMVEGDWFAIAAVLSLTVGAIAATITGLKSLWGQAGLTAGSLTMMFLGNPFAGVGSAPELMPQPVGGLGQLLPPGAGGNLLRSTGYFDGAGAGGHVAVLATWALFGFTLLAVAGYRARRAAAAPVPVAA